MNAQELRRYAREGARLQLERILTVFPDLAPDVDTNARRRTAKARSAAKWRAKTKRRVHWTQTPAGRRKMSTAQKAAWKARKAAA